MNEKALTAKEVQQKIGLGRTTIWRLEKNGQFPKRRKFGIRAVRWLESEVDKWLESRKEAA